MDPRHESREQALLNRLIGCINSFMVDHYQLLAEDKALHQSMTDICNQIYASAKARVDVANTLSIENLTSSDRVIFPSLLDSTVDLTVGNEQFVAMLLTIQRALPKQIADRNAVSYFAATINKIINQYIQRTPTPAVDNPMTKLDHANITLLSVLSRRFSLKLDPDERWHKQIAAKFHLNEAKINAIKYPNENYEQLFTRLSAPASLYFLFESSKRDIDPVKYFNNEHCILKMASVPRFLSFEAVNAHIQGKPGTYLVLELETEAATIMDAAHLDNEIKVNGQALLKNANRVQVHKIDASDNVTEDYHIKFENRQFSYANPTYGKPLI